MNKSIKKDKRDKKKQLGQFLTPIQLSEKIIKNISIKKGIKILEPSFGNGSFLFHIIDKLIQLYSEYDTLHKKLDMIFINNIYGCEIDEPLYKEFFNKLYEKYRYKPQNHNLILGDFLLQDFNIDFDVVIGNPPFGGTINLQYQDQLDKKYGMRYGIKIKKETYSFFIVKCNDLLKNGGILYFICSDTFLTIKTMKGLRNVLMEDGKVIIKPLSHFSEETDYGMVFLAYKKGETSDCLMVGNKKITYKNVRKTDNYSWAANDELIRYFSGKTLKEYITCSSGMTIGANELFVKRLNPDGTFIENKDYTFVLSPWSVDEELSKARLNKLSENKKYEITQKIKNRETYRKLIIKETECEIKTFPHPDYKLYNKASNECVYAKPSHVIYWKDDGDAVYTFKKTGPWYLNGVGGKKFFNMEGLTWCLISDRIKIRYLPSGYILDSGSPIAILKDNIDNDELFFIMGWLLTDFVILKTVINHTKNIQGKDVERLPYPFWVDDIKKKDIISLTKNMIEEKKKTNIINKLHLETINKLFEYKETTDEAK